MELPKEFKSWFSMYQEIKKIAENRGEKITNDWVYQPHLSNKEIPIKFIKLMAFDEIEPLAPTFREAEAIYLNLLQYPLRNTDADGKDLLAEKMNDIMRVV